MQDLIGRTLGHYRIVEKIGEGGMGVVYRAQDERLDRDVAIKVIREAVAQDEDRLARFEREAKAVAKLAHPNILEIWDFGLEDGVTYAVTELLDGQNLRQSIPASGMPWQKVVQMGAAIADGLAAAHGKGIVHRDLKPENVFVTSDGRVKILDFGLAQVKEPVEEEAETATLTPAGTVPGSVMGTMGYMSPEQLRGESSDARSDIFALGCVLYEMLSGQSAFLRHSTAETTVAIIKEEPERLSTAGVVLPADVERSIHRCLEKSPEARFQSASDLAFNLKSISTDQVISPVTEAKEPPAGKRKRTAWIVGLVAVSMIAAVALWINRSPPVEETQEASIPRIVVLPFENLGSPDDEYFADGMTEEITSRLSAVSGLLVISRTSAMQYKDTDKAIGQIGDELDVQYALEGTVRWERGDDGHGRVRITPQLIKVADDTHFWSDRYDRAIESVFEVQSDIAEQVVGQLHVRLLKTEEDALGALPTDNPEAYEAFLRGQHHAFANDAQHWPLALKMFERAVELDPEFAVAWSHLAVSYTALRSQAPEYRSAAKQAAERALEIDPALPDAHYALGNYYYRCDRDYERALADFARALAISPNHELALSSRAWVLRRQGRWEESTNLLERVFEASPRSSIAAWNLSITFQSLRDFLRAEEYADLAISLAPDHTYGYGKKFEIFFFQGRWRDAQMVLEELPESPPWTKIARIDLEIAERRFDAALARVHGIPEEGYEQVFGNSAAARRALDECACYFFLGDQRGVQEACGRARVAFEERTRESPDNLEIHEGLGLVHAYLGRKNDAIREGERAVELMPVAKDALSGPRYVRSLAAIDALVGEPDAAIDQIEYLLSIPSKLTVGYLRVHPAWDPLRDHPRFQALLEEYDTN